MRESSGASSVSMSSDSAGSGGAGAAGVVRAETGGVGIGSAGIGVVGGCCSSVLCGSLPVVLNCGGLSLLMSTAGVNGIVVAQRKSRRAALVVVAESCGMISGAGIT
jgi:hypothetical protein